jgi:hypothetical protein
MEVSSVDVHHPRREPKAQADAREGANSDRDQRKFQLVEANLDVGVTERLQYGHLTTLGADQPR